LNKKHASLPIFGESNIANATFLGTSDESPDDTGAGHTLRMPFVFPIPVGFPAHPHRHNPPAYHGQTSATDIFDGITYEQVGLRRERIWGSFTPLFDLHATW
jgi:hypothetical protein